MGPTDPRQSGVIDLDALNVFARERMLRTDSGQPLRFVDARTAPPGAYERIVTQTGCVPTRTHGPGMLHDWFNALSWLAFPLAKRRLNAVHADAMPPTGVAARRGRVRDVATLLDESGAAFLCRNERLREAFVERDWTTLFVHERASFVRDVRVVVFGHASFEKLLAPFKSICAHALVLPSPRRPADDEYAIVAAVDAALADALRLERMAQLRLHPLPLLGVPGWCDANEDPSWYDDEAVFRRTRGAAARAGDR